jgi:hypothetical protein
MVPNEYDLEQVCCVAWTCHAANNNSHLALSIHICRATCLVHPRLNPPKP